MKKYLFIASAAVLFAACSSSNDNVNDIDDTQVPIGFTSVYLEKTTRNAGEMADKTALEQNGNTMQVWGWKYYTAEGEADATETKVFGGTTVTYDKDANQSPSNSKWVYSPIKFWDKAASYKFYGVAPTGVFSINETSKILSATSVPAIQVLYDNNGATAIASAASTAVDYLAADMIPTAVGAKGNDTDKDVAFTFKHILSKLTVLVKTTNFFDPAKSGKTYPYIELTGLKIKLQGMCSEWTQATTGAVVPWTATTTGGTTTWEKGDNWGGTVVSDLTPYTCFKVGGDVAAKKLTSTAAGVAAYLVAPTELDTDAPKAYTYKVTVDYTIHVSAEESEDYQRSNVEIEGLDKFIQGTANTLTLTITNDPIIFDVKEVKSWSESLNGTVVVDEY